MSQVMRHPVLLVANDPEVLKGLVVCFPRNQYQPLAARAGGHVAERFKDRYPLTLAVVHEELSDVSGFEMCRWLRGYGVKAIVLLTRGLPPHLKEGGGDFDAALKFPAIPGMFEETVYKLLQSKLQSDDPRDKFIHDVQARVEAMDNQDYYALLGLEFGAAYDEIRNVYDRMSLQFHPDQHVALRSHPVAPLLNAFYKRVGEAYRVLTSDSKRDLYDKQIASGGDLRYDYTIREKEGPIPLEDYSEIPTVKRFLKLAQVSLGSGDLKSALQNLKFAKSMDSSNEKIAEKIAEVEAQVG